MKKILLLITACCMLSSLALGDVSRASITPVRNGVRHHHAHRAGHHHAHHHYRSV